MTKTELEILIKKIDSSIDYSVSLTDSNTGFIVKFSYYPKSSKEKIGNFFITSEEISKYETEILAKKLIREMKNFVIQKAILDFDDLSISEVDYICSCLKEIIFEKI